MERTVNKLNLEPGIIIFAQVYHHGQVKEFSLPSCTFKARVFDWIGIFFSSFWLKILHTVSFSKFLSPHLLADVRTLHFKAYYDLMIFNTSNSELLVLMALF